MSENKKYADFLWSLLVKARAGFKSELSGKTEQLHSHHLRGKSSYSLRYCLDNGICITAGEHIFGFHHSERRTSYEEKVKLLRGEDIFVKLESKRQEQARKLPQIIEWLETELAPYTDQIREYSKGRRPKSFYTRLLKKLESNIER